MTSGTHTNTDNMDAHGQKLTGEITSSLQKAHDAAMSVELGLDALGFVCQLWSVVFSSEVTAAEQMLKQLPKTVETSGNKVLEASQEFKNRDGDAANNLGRLI